MRFLPNPPKAKHHIVPSWLGLLLLARHDLQQASVFPQQSTSYVTKNFPTADDEYPVVAPTHGQTEESRTAEPDRLMRSVAAVWV